jgi:hypothetical protein
MLDLAALYQGVEVDSKGDIIDQANEAAELFRLASLSQRKPDGPDATGHCLNCDARLLPKQRWCDVMCREDWEKARRAEFMAPREPDAIV